MKVYIILWDCDKKGCGNSVFITVKGSRESAQVLIDLVENADVYIEEHEIEGFY